MDAKLQDLLKSLVHAGVDFILIGGVAGIVHGAARVTYDVDVVYARSAVNIERLVTALAPFAPYLRGAPPGLPFVWDERTLRNGLNFTLTTSAGEIDLLGEVLGGGAFEQLEAHSFHVEAFGVSFACVTLPKLIELKRAAGRPKDLESLAELDALLHERDA